MSTRLANGGRLLNKAQPQEFTFNGKRLKGVEGDTLASALLANDQMLVGRSFKYHRPRGIVSSGSEEPNALVGLGEDARFEPNQRVTTTELFDGLTCASQNHWPSLEFDVGAINAKLSRFLPAGFYYKTFMFPRPFWKHVYEPIIRATAIRTATSISMPSSMSSSSVAVLPGFRPPRRRAKRVPRCC